MKKTKKPTHFIVDNVDDIINDHVPASTLRTIGAAFKHFSSEDILEIGSTILKEDLGPLLNSLIKNTHSLKEKGSSAIEYLAHLGQTAKKEGLQKLASEIKNDSQKLLDRTTQKTAENYHETVILIPETKKRLNEFSHNVLRDFSLLQTDEERGKYILKLVAYSSLFILAFQQGSTFPKMSEQKNFIRKTLIPVLMVNASLTVINRVLEQAEKSVCHDPQALEVIREVRKFVKIVNMGVGSGMTIQALVDGLTRTNLTPKGRIDSLVHSTVMALFSQDLPAHSEE